MAKRVWISGGGKVWGTWEDLFYQNDEKHFQLEKRKHVISPQIYTYIYDYIYILCIHINILKYNLFSPNYYKQQKYERSMKEYETHI